MNESQQKSILQMARGAIQERADYEMSRLLANIARETVKAFLEERLAEEVSAGTVIAAL